MFEYSASGGVKVRKTNTILIDKKYYLLIKSNFENTIPKELNYVYEGSIVLSGQLCKVGSIVFHGHIDTHAFDKANAFLKNRFGIQLSKGESQLLPIWPPAINSYDTLLFETGNNTFKALCYVKSYKKEPTVFQYIGTGFSEVPLDDRRVVSFRLSEMEYPVSIDRQYFGKNYYIKKNTKPIPAVEAELKISDNAHQPYHFSNYDGLPSGEALKIESSFPLTVLKTNNRGNEYYYIESKEPVYIEKIKREDILVFYSATYLGAISFSQRKVLIQNSSVLTEELIALIERDESPLAPIEWWIYKVLSIDCIDDRLEQFIFSYIMQGFIPTNTRNRLYSLIKEIRNESI